MWLVFLFLVAVQTIRGDYLWHNYYQATIVNDTAHLCHAAIINDYNIIAPTSCLMKHKKSQLRLRSATTKNDFRFDDIVGVCLNSNYEEQSNGKRINDIAVARISQPISGPHMHIPMFAKGQSVEPEAIGEIGNIGSSLTDVDPQSSFVIVTDKNTCKEAYAEKGGISPGQFCADSPNTEHCNDDDGTALILNGELAGIKSHWTNSHESVVKGTGVYTEIAYYRDFIDKCQQTFQDKNERGYFDGPL
ncbi:hypothetical protein QAD02_011876, partial [Eretmocerus hayati]